MAPVRADLGKTRREAVPDKGGVVMLTQVYYLSDAVNAPPGLLR